MKLDIKFSHNDVETTFKFDSEYPTLRQANELIKFVDELKGRLEDIYEEMLKMKPY